MKLTWWSNAPWANTGYGTQTRLFVPRIKDDGHDIAVAANFGLDAAPTTWRGIPILPVGNGLAPEALMLAHHQAWGADWLVTLYDVWPLINLKGHEQTRVASWVPVDHWPVPPEVLRWFGGSVDGAFKPNGHVPLAMSRFGQTELGKQGLDSHYVPHGIDTKVYTPTPTPDVRAALGLKDTDFLVVINAANKGGTPVRKAWSEMLGAFTLFSQRHDNAHIYLHTNLVGIGGTAPHLEIMLEALGVASDRVHLVDQYLYQSGQFSDTALAQMYSAADVLLATSMGEGFGLPVIEAQACGLPVIVTDFSAQPELVGSGWRVGYQPWFDHFQGAFLATPLIAEILRALEAAYEAKGDRSLKDKAVEFAQQYDADHVYATWWKPALADLAKRLEPPKISRQQRRAKRRAA